MKIAGIITEYNPFHNGHKYHIEESKRITGADHVIAVMSGNFVQRGTPAIIDKYSRAAMALHHGVDLVLELPACYSSASAEYFALGGVSLLHKLGIVDYLCFGSECGNIQLLKDTAQFLSDPPEGFDARLLSYLKEGLTYPAARLRALHTYLENREPPAIYDNETLSHVLSEPNNILGIEYIKALHSLSSPIIPYTIQRQSAHYHDKDLYDHISSATAIRNAIGGIKEDTFTADLKTSIPKDVFRTLTDAFRKTYPITEEDFSAVIRYKIISESNHLSDYVDISDDLADRITHSNLHDTMQDLALALKTKNVTLTRINRALTHLLLNIKKDTFQIYNENGYTPYARVLGFRKDASFLLKQISEKGTVPIITKLASAKEQLDSLSLQMLSEDIFAAHIYHQAVYEKYGTSLPNEYQNGICIIS